MQSSENNGGSNQAVPSTGSTPNPVSEREYDFSALDPKEKGFASKLVENAGNIAQTAADCGISVKTAHKYKDKPLVNAYIAKLQEDHEFTSLFNNRVYESRLLLLHDMAMGNIPVPMVDKDGTEYEAKCFHPSLALSTIQELGKSSGVTKEEKQGRGDVIVNIDVGALTGDTPVSDGITIEHE